MGAELKIKEANKIQKGTVIYKEKEPVTSICVVVKGKVTAKNEFIKMELSMGAFIGIVDFATGRYLLDYEASTDCVVYPFEATKLSELRNVFATNNKEYKGIVVTSMVKMYADLYAANVAFTGVAKTLHEVLSAGYAKYIDACKNGGAAISEYVDLSKVSPYVRLIPLDENEQKKILEMTAIPAEAVKAFFGPTTELVMEKIDVLSKATVEMLEEVMNQGSYIDDKCAMLYSDGDGNLLALSMKLASELENWGRPDKSLETMCTGLLKSFNEAESVKKQFMGDPRLVNRNRLAKIIKGVALTEEEEADNEANMAKDEDLYRSLKNSMRTILTFGDVPTDIAKEYEEAVNAFVDSNDRMSTEEDGRKVRHRVSNVFYKVYKCVFLQSIKSSKIPLPAELFLDYGYTDERLVTRDEALEICKLKVGTKMKYCSEIFTIREWLMAVYSGKREPSKNEFDTEYNEFLREQKKNKSIDEEEEKRRLANPEMRLDYEIFNMFKYTHRSVNGQLSTFIPILCSEQITGSPMRAAVTKDRIGQQIEKCRDLDYSAYRREMLFADKELGIEKEPIQVEVCPDIILFPCFGQNATMWQEISCKRRDTPGRILFPIMFDGNLEALLIKQIGRFRWELCRTMQGTAWNNIQFKSLTSEYSDYIQYYKKNHDLTDDRKEKVKMQIVKAKNNLREVFVQDYENWIRYESQGGMKLNKPSREILAKYVPFKKEVRENLKTQPAFSEAIEVFTRENAKKAREVELRMHAITKNKIEVPEPIKETYKFYTEY